MRLMVFCLLLGLTNGHLHHSRQRLTDPGHSLYTTRSHAKVVLTIEGRAKHFNEWRQLIENMRYQNAVDVIYGTYDEEIQDCTLQDHVTLSEGHVRADANCSLTPTVVCLNILGTTYTPGRNMIAKAVYKLQQCRGEAYKYWLLVDEDARQLRCAMCEGATVENSCCFDTLVHYLLLDSVNYASISLSSYAASPDHKTEGGLSYIGAPYHTLVHNCFEAQIQAVHWEATPIYFPCIELFESKSWWECHALQNYLSVACIPGANVLLGGYAWSNFEHSTYPVGRVTVAEELAVLKQVVPELYYLLKPANPKFKGYKQGNCAGVSVEGWQDPNYFFNDDSGWWLRSMRYSICMGPLKRIFNEYMNMPE